MKINKTGLINLFLLCVYWFLVIFLTVFLVSLSIAIVFIFKMEGLLLGGRGNKFIKVWSKWRASSGNRHLVYGLMKARKQT